MRNIYANLHSNQKILIYEMLRRGISVEILDEKTELIRASYRGHTELIYDRDSSIMPYSLSVLAGHKGVTKRLLNEANVSTPLGESFKISERDKILEAFDIIGQPVVIKPVHGSHGYDVYTNLQTEDMILESLDKILESRGPNIEVVIEEFFPAKEFRVFITTKRDYAVLNRDPAHIFGNGRSDIRTLIEEENYRRMNPRKNALCEILVDDEMTRYLLGKNMDYSYVPDSGEKVYLRPNSNIAMGGVSIDFTDEVHPSVINIAMECLRAFPGIPYLGIDFMTDDITKRQTSETYRIIEVNTVPGIDMHFRPAIGKSRNIAKYIVDLIYPETEYYEYYKEGENLELKKSPTRF